MKDKPVVVEKWPLIVHLLAACFCLSASAYFHLFYIIGDKCSDILSRMDYGGISILIMGSSYPPIFYCFTCKEVFWIRNFFLALITTTSTASFIATLHPVMNSPQLRSCRANIFIFLGLSAGLPFMFLHFAPKHLQPYINPHFDSFPWAFGGAVYIGGAIIYACRIPEKHYPLTFDYCGQSHNIFHVAVLLGCAIHLDAAMKLFMNAHTVSCPTK